MNHSSDDPDELVQKNVDLNHINKMSIQMHVPESITLGPNQTAIPRLHHDYDRLSMRMEVPDSIRLGNQNRTDLDNDTNHLLTTQQRLIHQSDIEFMSDEEQSDSQTPRNHRPIQMTESWHIEPFTNLDEKSVLNKFQLLQNRIHHIERTLARRNFRDQVVYSCLIGYFLYQAFLSFRRSMSN